MSKALNLYTDASVKGDFFLVGSQTGGYRQRRKVGPAMVGWVGWHAVEPHVKPTVVGQAYVGNQGIQRAEMQAAIYGLQAVLNHVACGTERPDEIVLHVDNETVALILQGKWRPNLLRESAAVAKSAIDSLMALGISVAVVQVERKHAVHKNVHTLTKKAWDHLFWNTSWRPVK